jgi:formiminotetrahydrofolate cyclodeaminase
VADAELVSRSVQEFVAGVASVDEPVPAAGSVAALTGAASAALLALVCEVQARKLAGGDATVERQRADSLQQRLLGLVDEDAHAFRAFLSARRTQVGLDEALALTTQTPLEIAAACAEVVALGTSVETHTHGLLLGDVRSARTLAGAAREAALEVAKQNVALLHADPPAQQRLQEEINRLRILWAENP